MKSQKTLQYWGNIIFLSFCSILLFAAGFTGIHVEWIRQGYEVQLSENVVKIKIIYRPENCKTHRDDYVEVLYKNKKYKVNTSFFNICQISTGEIMDAYHIEKYDKIFIPINLPSLVIQIISAYILLVTSMLSFVFTIYISTKKR